MDNVIYANFTAEFRSLVFTRIKSFGGHKRIKNEMIEEGFHPSFAKAIVRSITRKEGW